MSKELAKAEESNVVAVNDASSIMEVIGRAATDPSFDADKMEKLLGMYERISERNAKVAFHGALAEMQPNLPVITENGEIKHGNKLISKYALWEDINRAIRPVLKEHGFALSFRIGSDGEKVTVTAILSHREGHNEDTTITLDKDGSGSKNIVQAVGSSVSYGKRYAAEAILNIITEGVDDDGETASDTRKRDYGKDEPVVGAMNKTTLQQKLREFDQQLWACTDSGELHGLLQSYEAILAQAKRDLPSWWWTKQGADSLGIHDRIEARKSELAKLDKPRME